MGAPNVCSIWFCSCCGGLQWIVSLFGLILLDKRQTYVTTTDHQMHLSLTNKIPAPQLWLQSTCTFNSVHKSTSCGNDFHVHMSPPVIAYPSMHRTKVWMIDKQLFFSFRCLGSTICGVSRRSDLSSWQGDTGRQKLKTTNTLFYHTLSMCHSNGLVITLEVFWEGLEI